MTKEELKIIYSVYFPYKLEVQHIDTDWAEDRKINVILTGVFEDCLTFNQASDYYYNDEDIVVKPILWDLSYLTKDELRSAGFDHHIDYLTHEREGWIEKYGFENYIKKLPYGHYQYLVSKHYNVFNLPEYEYINKATLTTNK